MVFYSFKWEFGSSLAEIKTFWKCFSGRPYEEPGYQAPVQRHIHQTWHSGDASRRLSHFAWWRSLDPRARWHLTKSTDWPDGNAVIKRSKFQILNGPHCYSTGSVLMKIGGMMHLVTNWPEGEGGPHLLPRKTLCCCFGKAWCVRTWRCFHMAAFSQKGSWGQRADVLDYFDYSTHNYNYYFFFLICREQLRRAWSHNLRAQHVWNTKQ